ncbi:MAG: hypothetical protein V3W41_19575 [Planctomycetota bacterium]
MAFVAFGLLATFSASGLAAFGWGDGWIPDPALALCLAASLVAERHRDLTLALVLGLAAGLFSATPWGLKPLAFLMAAMMISTGRRSARLDRGLSQFAVAAGAAGLAGLVEFCVAKVELGFFRGLGELTLRALGTAVLTLVVLRLFGKGRLLQRL